MSPRGCASALQNDPVSIIVQRSSFRKATMSA
jgi:hypothetical protein